MLTIADAAARLGIDPSRVRLLVRQGRIPARKFGRAWMISKADLDAYHPRPQGKPGHRPQT
jgi:excisionase family DNA binding protein